MKNLKDELKKNVVHEGTSRPMLSMSQKLLQETENVILPPTPDSSLCNIDEKREGIIHANSPNFKRKDISKPLEDNFTAIKSLAKDLQFNIQHDGAINSASKVYSDLVSQGENQKPKLRYHGAVKKKNNDNANEYLKSNFVNKNKETNDTNIDAKTNESMPTIGGSIEAMQTIPRASVKVDPSLMLECHTNESGFEEVSILSEKNAYDVSNISAFGSNQGALKSLKKDLSANIEPSKKYLDAVPNSYTKENVINVQYKAFDDVSLNPQYVKTLNKIVPEDSVSHDAHRNHSALNANASKRQAMLEGEPLFARTVTPLPKHDKTLFTTPEFTSYGKAQYLCPEGNFDGEPQRRISTTQRHMPELLSYWKEMEAETKGQFLFLIAFCWKSYFLPFIFWFTKIYKCYSSENQGTRNTSVRRSGSTGSSIRNRYHPKPMPSVDECARQERERIITSSIGEVMQPLLLLSEKNFIHPRLVNRAEHLAQKPALSIDKGLQKENTSLPKVQVGSQENVTQDTQTEKPFSRKNSLKEVDIILLFMF